MTLSIEGEPLSDAPETLVAYGSAHVAALAVIATAAAVAVWVVCARASAVGSRAVPRVCRALAGLMLGNMIFEQCYRVVTGQWSLAESLPLHLCDLSVFAAIAALVLATRASVLAHATRSGAVPLAARLPVPTTHAANTGGQSASGTRALFDVVYYWGLAGATQALLTPSVDQGFPGPLFFTYFTAHGSIIIAVLVLMFGLRLRPRRGSGRREHGRERHRGQRRCESRAAARGPAGRRGRLPGIRRSSEGWGWSRTRCSTIR